MKLEKFDFFMATNPEGRAIGLLYPVSELLENLNTPVPMLTFLQFFDSSTKLNFGPIKIVYKVRLMKGG